MIEIKVDVVDLISENLLNVNIKIGLCKYCKKYGKCHDQGVISVPYVIKYLSRKIHLLNVKNFNLEF